jgi:glycogenin glucosyltransferase
MGIKFTFLDLPPLLNLLCAAALHISLRLTAPAYPGKAPATADCAFVTVTTPAFCMGAVAIGHNLRKFHGQKYDLICLVTSDVNETWVAVLSQW